MKPPKCSMWARYPRKLRHSSNRGDISQFVCLIGCIISLHCTEQFIKWKKYTTLTASCCILRMIVPNKKVGHFKSSHDPHPLVVWTLGAPVTDWALVAPESVLPPRASSDPILRTIPPLHPSDPIPLRVNLNPWVWPVSLGSQPIVVCLSALQDPSVS